MASKHTDSLSLHELSPCNLTYSEKPKIEILLTEIMVSHSNRFIFPNLSRELDGYTLFCLAFNILTHPDPAISASLCIFTSSSNYRMSTEASSSDTPNSTITPNTTPSPSPTLSVVSPSTSSSTMPPPPPRPTSTSRPGSISSGSSTLPPEQMMAQRRTEVDRIMTCLRINPLRVLGLRTDATVVDIRAKYKTLSILVHPDKCAPDFADRARSAFEMVNAARLDLLDDQKRDELNQVIVHSRKQVAARWTEEKRNPPTDNEATTMAAGGNVDWSRDPEFENEVAKEVDNNLIDMEYRSRKLVEKKKAEEIAAQEELQRKRKEAEEREQDDKEWEKSRENRVNDWRAFTRNNKMARIIRAPPSRAEREVGKEDTGKRRTRGEDEG